MNLLALVGPTAVGKTAVGIALAERLGAEIVSADAVAVYRGLDIGAAKPTPEERERIAFHLVDVVTPAQEFTLADFEHRAQAAIRGIRERGRLPLLVGGTGLYVRAVTRELALPAVAPQPAIRERLWADVEAQGAPALHARLCAIDPEAAAKIAPGDGKRIIRALEVWEVTGQPLSAFHTPEGVQGKPRDGVALWGLEREREALYRRIDERVEAMMRAGFLDEVQGLLAAGYDPQSKAMQSLGYRHLVGHLHKGVPWAQTLAELKRDTRRFAKRQLSWFRNDASVRWIAVGESESPEEIVERLARRMEGLIDKQ